MTTQSPTAWMLSASLHVFVAAVIAFFTYTASLNARKEPRILELVAGEGDNFAATVAPALGTPGGIKVDVPKPVEPQPMPAAPVTPEAAPIAPVPAPVAPAPTPKALPPTPTKQADTTVPNFEKQIRRQVIIGESRAKLQLKREREAEAKRLAEEKKRLAEESKKMSKADYDAKNKATRTQPPSKSAPPKIARIDAQGIAKGVLGGSPENTKGGAGGKALVSNNDDVVLAYYALFKQELRRLFESPPGLSDTLNVTINVRSHPDGTLSTARVTKTSGSREFDRSVLDTIARIRMPARPDRKTEPFDFVFTMRELNER